MENKNVIFSNVIEVNPSRTLKKGIMNKFVDMKSVEPFTRNIAEFMIKEFNGSGSKFKNGDTIFARITPCLENGKTAFIDNLGEDEVAFGSTEFIVFTGKDGVSDNKYVYYLLRTPQIREYAIKNMVGTSGRQRVDKTCFDKLEINLPNLDKQKKVAWLLSSLDDKIKLNKEINNTLEKMAQAIFKSWFVDFEPFKDGAFEESELGMIPKGWKVVELSDIGTIVTGKTPSKNNPEHFGDEFKFITPKDIKGDIFMVDTERGLSFAGYKKMERIKFDKYSIGVSCIGSDLGEVYLNDTTGVSNQQINTLILDDINLYPYMYIKLKSMKNDFKNIASGSAVPIINKTTFSKIKIIVPPKNVYDEYFKNVNVMFDRILSNLKQNIDLGETRDTLLPNLIGL